MFADSKLFLQGLYEVVGVFFTNIVDAKIINDEAKYDRTGDVLP